MSDKTLVAILSYNHPGITEKCVHSALDFFESSRIFLIHNGSRSEVVSQLKAKFPEINHLEFSANSGFSGGATRGINHIFQNTKTPSVLFLSNDTRLMKYSNPEVEVANALVGCLVELRDTERVHSWGAEVDLLRGQLSHVRNDLNAKGFYIPGAAFLVGRRAWEAVEGFDETLNSYWEDVDLSLRARSKGVSLLLTNKIVVRHGVGKTTGGDPFYSVYLFHRNRKRVVLRHGSCFERLGFIAIYFLSTLRKLFKYLIRKDFKRAKLLLQASLSW